MTLRQIDERIDSLRAALDNVEEALVEVDGDDFRRILAATPLTGDTAARWAKADSEARLTWTWFLAVKDWFGAIVERRGTKASLAPELCEQLLADLGRRPAEILPGSPPPGAASPSASPPAGMDRLLQAILAANDQVRVVVGRVAAIWQGTAPKLGALETEASALEQEATHEGLRVPNDLVVARRLLAEVRTRCSGDPLSVDPNSDPIAPIAGGLERARVAIHEAIAGRRAFAQETTAATAEIDRAISEVAAARAREQESAEKISGSTGLSEIDRAATGLGRLRAELEEIRSDTNVDEAVQALASLRARLSAAVEQARRLAASGGASLARRNELRGRLDAYRAKALAIGRAEDSELDSLYRQAMDALFTAPCDLRHSESLVLAYQRALTPPRRAVDV